MIVVDANIISYYFIKSEKTDLAQRIREKDPDWAIPAFWKYEFLNVLSKYSRFNGMTLDESKTLFREAVDILSEKEVHTDPENVLGLSVMEKISVYDSEYVSLAISLGCKLVTADKELLRKFPEIAVSMEDFTNAGSFKFVKEKRSVYGKRADRS
jgi:predicted nucleic acid-binding protein